MKTSNKLLLSGVLFVILLFLVFNLYSRKFIAKNDTKNVIESGIEEQKILLENYDSDTLYLVGINCILDPSSTSVSVKTDKEYLPYFAVKNNRGIYPYHEPKSGNTYFSFPAKYTIGVKGKSNLVVITKKNSEVYSEGKLNIENLTIKANSDSVISIDNDGENLVVTCKNNAQIDLEGSFKNGEISCEYKSSIDAMKISFDSLNINLSESSYLRIKSVNNLYGEMEDRSVFETVEECNVSGLKFFDKAKHKLESWD